MLRLLAASRPPAAQALSTHTRPRGSPPSQLDGKGRYRPILAVFAPLALSSLFMSAGEQTVVVSGVSRMANPEVGLAAYGVALSLSIAMEAPINLMMTTSVALVRDRQSYDQVWRFTWLLGLLLVCANVVLYWGPVYPLLLVPLLRLPADVAHAALAPLRLMVLWPLVIACRKFFQGVLITSRRTRIVGVGTVIRLTTASSVTIAGAMLFHPAGALLAGVALISSIVLEAIVVAAWTVPLAWRTVRSRRRDGPPLTMRQLWVFHAPLITTAALRVLLQPLIAAGMTRAAEPALSLAAWPVAFGLASLVASPAWALPELTITFRRTAEEVRTVLAFTWRLGIGMLLALLLLVATPLATLYFRGLLAVPASVAVLAHGALWFLLPLPVMLALQALSRGTLAAASRTAVVQLAMGANVATVGVVFVVGATAGLAPGAVVAGAGISLALAVENLLLFRARRRVDRGSTAAPADGAILTAR